MSAEPLKENKNEQALDNNSVPVPSSEAIEGEVLDDVSELTEHIVKQVAVKFRQISHSGPLPHPDLYREYAALIPNGGERLMVQAESEQTQRHWRESHQEWRQSAGLMAGFIIALAGIGVAVYALSIGQPLAGFATLFTVVGSIVGAFIYGTNSNSSPKEIRPASKTEDNQAESITRNKEE